MCLPHCHWGQVQIHDVTFSSLYVTSSSHLASPSSLSSSSSLSSYFFYSSFVLALPLSPPPLHPPYLRSSFPLLLTRVFASSFFLLVRALLPPPLPPLLFFSFLVLTLLYFHLTSSILFSYQLRHFISFLHPSHFTISPPPPPHLISSHFFYFSSFMISSPLFFLPFLFLLLALLLNHVIINRKKISYSYYIQSRTTNALSLIKNHENVCLFVCLQRMIMVQYYIKYSYTFFGEATKIETKLLLFQQYCI